MDDSVNSLQGLVSGIGKREMKKTVEDIKESIMNLIDECECGNQSPQSTRCKLSDHEHALVKSYLELGQPKRDERRVHALSFSSDSYLPHISDPSRSEDDARRPTLSKQEGVIDPGYVSSSPTPFDDCDYACSTDFNYHVKCGKVFMFNNLWFKTNCPPRNGADVEGKSLLEKFKKLGFQTESFYNKEKDEMQGVLNYIAISNDLSNCDCVVVICMSHGTEDGILCSDGKPYKIDDIINEFTGEKSKAIGIPKIFIFQTCRGTEEDKGYLVPRGPNDVIKDGHSKHQTVTRLPKESDILVTCSTMHGMVSHKIFDLETKQTISWFVSEMNNIISKYGDTDDILTLMTKVNFEVSLTKEHCPYYDMPCIFSTLRKKVYLK